MPLKAYDSGDYKRFTFRSELCKAINTLEGILEGIVIDRQINKLELMELRSWCKINRQYIDRHPFNEIIPKIDYMLSDGILTEDEKEDILWVCKNLQSGSEFYNLITCDIQRLQGIIHGILIDGTITDEEVLELKEWLNENDHLSSTYPYDEVYSLVTAVLNDGKIDNSERDMLKVFFSDFIDLNASCLIDIKELRELKNSLNISGICTICPEVVFDNMNFCFTGSSSRTTRSKLQNIIEGLNATFHNNVRKDTNYLIVGNEGNKAWAFSCYGRKVEKAMQLRKSGHEILIVHENDFWDAIEDFS